jgi:phosphatidylglycerophosphatase A
VWLAAWGPCGLSPVAPGTVGTVGAIPLFWLLRPLPLWLYLVTLAAFVALAIRAAAAAGVHWKTPDASPIVIDEVAGYLVTMALVPWSPGGALLGFLLFRVFDVLKPWPASALDRWKTGAGVVADDLAAGAWAAAAYAATVHLLRAFPGCDPATAFWCLELLP